MKLKADVDEKEYRKLVDKIVSNSEYQRKVPEKRTMMTVPEMGKMLGLKKTGRYWLVHQNYFKTEELYGQLRIDLESFEKWYANQVRYHKINGEPPGRELKERSYSVKDLARMLDISDGVMFDLIHQNNIETILVDHWTRVPREAFWNWYNNQTRYRTSEDRERDAEIEESSLSMPEMARELGITRNQVYTILASNKYKDIFEIIIVADRKRITRESFEKFLSAQNKYRLDTKNMEENESADDYEIEKSVGKKKVYTGKRMKSNRKYLTVKDAAAAADVSRAMISKWFKEGKFSVTKVGNRTLIHRKEFEKWLANEQKGADA